MVAVHSVAGSLQRHPLGTSVAAILLALSGCGGDDAEPQTTAQTLTCGEDLAAIVDAFRSGLPTFDYNPAADVLALTERVDLVVTGTVASIERNYEPDSYGPDSPGDDSWTTATTADAQIVARTDEAAAEEVEAFSTFSKWVVRDEVDPLGGPVVTEDLAYVAFLRRSPDVPGGFDIDVQGLHLSCVGSDDAVTSAIEPLPGDVAGLSLDGLVAAVSDSAAR